MVKKCPLKFLGDYNISAKTKECSQAECGWWSSERGECAVVGISDATEVLSLVVENFERYLRQK